MKNKKLTLEALKKFIVDKAYRILQEENESEVKTYKFKVKHDNGSFTIKTTGSSPEAAKKKIMSHQGAPENAVTLISEEEDEKFDNSGEEENPLEKTAIDLREPETIEEPTTPEASEKHSEFSNINPKVNSLASKIDFHKLTILDAKINKAINTGRLNSDFNYLTTVLASLYHNENIPAEGKSNIRKALWESMAHPYELTSYERGQGGERPSILSRVVARKANVHDFGAKSKTIDGSYYKDIIADSIFKAIDYSLDNFKDSFFFPTLVIFNASSRTISEVQSKSAKTAFSSKVGGIKGQSLDEPLGSADDERDETRGDRFTGEEGQKSTAQKEAAKELANVMESFVVTRLEANIKHGGANPAFLEVAKLLFKGHNLSEIADMLKTKENTIRQWKARMQAIITEYVKNGSFQKYIKDKTGIRVHFPDSSYVFAVQGKLREPGEEKENLEYFQETGVDADGNPTGKWISITPEKEEEEEAGGGYYDKYGNLAFGDEEKNDEEAPEEETAEDLGPEDQALTESFIAKEIMKRVNNRILKEYFYHPNVEQKWHSITNEEEIENLEKKKIGKEGKELKDIEDQIASINHIKKNKND